MSIHSNRKASDADKQLPGCLGVMANLFDVSAGLAGNRLLTDRPHLEGSPVARSLSDVAVMVDPFNRDQVEDKRTMSDVRRSSSSRKSNITPIKMLIAQEMSKEVDSKQSPTNLVAKLMGLDALPIQLPKSITQRIQYKSHLQQSRSLSHSGRQTEYSRHGRSFSDDQMQHRFQENQEYGNYKDIYDMWQHSQLGNPKREKSSAKGRSSDTVNENKIALVREKFIEAKRLAPDEKLRQSKEFQDAVEVLSSNRDLFLQFLQEPNSLFSKHMHEYHSIPSPPETKRITILKPSKMVDNDKFSGLGKKSECPTKKSSQVAQGSGWDQSVSGYSSPYACEEVDDYPTQPTRIVVLKPGHGNGQDIMSVVPPPSSSPGMLHGDNYLEADDEVEETREVAKEITRQMRENLTGHRRHETLLSSVFSNGYIGDDSSFNRSENEYLEGNLSDSEVVSPTSRHSWDFINRADSPYSASSFSRASYSPESSVCREAKKRLFERWALLASNQNSPEQRHAQKSSSTLGEMLSLSDSKKPVTLKENGDRNKDQEVAQSSSSLANGVDKGEATAEDSPKNLARSKSVPVSSTVYDNRLNVQVPEPESTKSVELGKKATGKSSLKSRVSSLFFSRSRKSSKDKSSQSKDECRSTSSETAESSGYPHEKVGSSIPNVAAGNLNESHEQPSPVSVLDQSFEDEKITSDVFGKQVSSQMLKSNLIDKSPPIGSLARTLSWDDSYAETTSPYSLRNRTAQLCSDEEEDEDEQDWLVFVRDLLSAAGLEGKDLSDSSLPDWYSPESPLDPSLRDKFAALDDKEAPLPEAKRRQRRSNRKLAFDRVSALIVEEIKGQGEAAGHEGPISAERVWAQMKGWFTKEGGGVGGGGDSLVVERVVRNEVVGRWWVENLRMEVDKLGLEIEGKLLQELVDEAVGEFSGTGTA